MTSRVHQSRMFVFALLGVLAACQQQSKLKPVTRSPDSTNAGRDAAGLDLGLGNGNGSGSGTTPLGDAGACVAETHAAQPSPADLLFLVDVSTSMLKPWVGTQSKYQTAKLALFDFVSDVKSANLGVGLAYFPYGYVDKPCLEFDDCGHDKELITKTGVHLATCIRNRYCQLTGKPPGEYSQCPTGMMPGNCVCGVTNDICPKTPAQHCSAPGECSGSKKMCPEVGKACPNGEGECMPVYGKCLILGDACAPKFYEKLRVPFADLPAGTKPFLDALDLTDVSAGWSAPLVAGVKGSMTVLQKRAAEPGARPSALVLVTGVQPGAPGRECQPTDPLMARADLEAAAKATPAIPTFVIGVVSAQDSPETNVVNQLAAAGGTGKAFVLDGTTDVAGRLHEALGKIRNSILACDFALPMPKAGALDVGKVNVTVQTSAGRTNLNYVGKSAGCHDAKGGWYYDVDPAAGQPKRVVLCTSSCKAVREDATGSVDVAFGCTSRVE